MAEYTSEASRSGEGVKTLTILHDDKSMEKWGGYRHRGLSNDVYCMDCPLTMSLDRCSLVVHLRQRCRSDASKNTTFFPCSHFSPYTVMIWFLLMNSPILVFLLTAYVVIMYSYKCSHPPSL
jgi:hypothetical protein